jgi:hypothetical protein
MDLNDIQQLAFQDEFHKIAKSKNVAKNLARIMNMSPAKIHGDARLKWATYRGMAHDLGRPEGKQLALAGKGSVVGTKGSKSSQFGQNSKERADEVMSKMKEYKGRETPYKLDPKGRDAVDKVKKAGESRIGRKPIGIEKLLENEAEVTGLPENFTVAPELVETAETAAKALVKMALSSTASKRLGLLAAGGAGALVARQAKEDHKLGRMVRKQQGQQ